MNQQKIAQFSKIEVRESKIQGNGVFAKQEIKKLDTILFFEGEEVNLKEVLKRIFEEGKERDGDPLQVNDKTYIIDLEEIAKSVNHSCNPNCFIKVKTSYWL
ncbi:hypothetical protein HY448_01170 [Candidatus Pacearchaeota archaeon]|nr:hypothetical protein [Candidatus Pacearchaeota archaeon]